MRLYLKAESDRHKEITIGGTDWLEVTLLHGSKKDSKQAVKVLLTYDPEKKETWLKIIGPKHGTTEFGKMIFDVSRQVLPE